MDLAGRGHPDKCLTGIRVSMSAQDTRRFTNTPHKRTRGCDNPTAYHESPRSLTPPSRNLRSRTICEEDVVDTARWVVVLENDAER